MDKGYILGGNGFNSPDIIKQAGSAAEGILVGAAWHTSSTAPANAGFVAAFQQEYGSKPDQFAAQAYTAVMLFAEAIRTSGGVNPSDIRDALLKIRNLDTPLGRFSFDGREPVHTAVVQIVRNGVFMLLGQ